MQHHRRQHQHKGKRRDLSAILDADRDQAVGKDARHSDHDDTARPGQRDQDAFVPGQLRADQRHQNGHRSRHADDQQHEQRRPPPVQLRQSLEFDPRGQQDEHA